MVNHLLLLNDMENFDYDDIDLDRRMNNGQLDKRYFTVLAIDHVEGLSLSILSLGN